MQGRIYQNHCKTFFFKSIVQESPLSNTIDNYENPLVATWSGGAAAFNYLDGGTIPTEDKKTVSVERASAHSA